MNNHLGGAEHFEVQLLHHGVKLSLKLLDCLHLLVLCLTLLLRVLDGRSGVGAVAEGRANDAGHPSDFFFYSFFCHFWAGLDRFWVGARSIAGHLCGGEEEQKKQKSCRCFKLKSKLPLHPHNG